VLDLGCLPRINQTGSQRSGKLQFLIGAFEQQRAPIRTTVRLIKLAMNWLLEYFRKDQTLCYLRHAQPLIPFCAKFLGKSYFTAGCELRLGFFHE
jgi:hypothetical protein